MTGGGGGGGLQCQIRGLCAEMKTITGIISSGSCREKLEFMYSQNRQRFPTVNVQSGVIGPCLSHRTILSPRVLSYLEVNTFIGENIGWGITRTIQFLYVDFPTIATLTP